MLICRDCGTQANVLYFFFFRNFSPLSFSSVSIPRSNLFLLSLFLYVQDFQVEKLEYDEIIATQRNVKKAKKGIFVALSLPVRVFSFFFFFPIFFFFHFFSQHSQGDKGFEKTELSRSTSVSSSTPSGHFGFQVWSLSKTDGNCWRNLETLFEVHFAGPWRN